MKNTRKKMLLSSIAMLLVALIALGSATFAWYITNATVTAETSQFSAASADGLVIRHNINDAWSAKITDLVTKDSLSPASIDYATFANLKGATGQGTAFDDGTLSGALTGATVENGTTFLVDTFYVASSSGSAKTCTFTIESGTVAGTYMNIAIFVGDTLQKVYTSTPSLTSTQKIEYSGGTYSTASDTQTIEALGNKTVTTTMSAADKNTGGTPVHIVAFADGYNSLCKNSTADTSQISVKYSFTATQS